MSADLTITATVITLSRKDLTPVGVTLRGTGNIPVPALHAIAEEALESFTGTVGSNGYSVYRTPTYHEKMEDTVTIFAVDEPKRG